MNVNIENLQYSLMVMVACITIWIYILFIVEPTWIYIKDDDGNVKITDGKKRYTNLVIVIIIGSTLLLTSISYVILDTYYPSLSTYSPTTQRSISQPMSHSQTPHMSQPPVQMSPRMSQPPVQISPHMSKPKSPINISPHMSMPKSPLSSRQRTPTIMKCGCV